MDDRSYPVIGLRGHELAVPEPPSSRALAALRTAALPPATPAFRFQFKKDYSRLYTNKHDRFVLREEHLGELRRLVREHKRDRENHGEPLSVSDIVNAALDLALEHPAAFHPRVDPTQLRESLGREVMKKAFIHFLQQDPLSF